VLLAFWDPEQLPILQQVVCRFTLWHMTMTLTLRSCYGIANNSWRIWGYIIKVANFFKSNSGGTTTE